MPFRMDNALIAAAAVVQRLADYRPTPQFHELWRGQIDALDFDDELKQALLDPDRIDAALDAMPSVGMATRLLGPRPGRPCP